MHITERAKTAAHQEFGGIVDNLLTAYNKGTLETTPDILLFALSYNRKRLDDELGDSDYSHLVDAARESSRALLYTPLKTGRPVQNGILAVRCVNNAFDLQPVYIDQHSVVSGEEDHPVIYKYAVDIQENKSVLVRQNDMGHTGKFVLDTIYVKARTSRVSNPGIEYSQEEFDSRFAMLDLDRPHCGMPTLLDINTAIDILVGGNRIRPLS